MYLQGRDINDKEDVELSFWICLRQPRSKYTARKAK
jgi:hypothetical protein